MSIALVQFINQAGFTTAPTIELDSVAAGNLLVLCVNLRAASTTVSSIIDSSGNTVSTAIALSTASATQPATGIYYVANASAGTHIFTVTFNTGGPNEVLFAGEFSGLSTTSPLDGTPPAINTGGPSNSLVSNSITPAKNGELLIACAEQAGSGGSVSSWTNGFTQIDSNTTVDSAAWAYLVQSTAAAITAGVTINGGTVWSVGIAAFQPPAAPSSPTGSPLLLLGV